MKIYKLEILIDGYGGRLKDRYFRDYDKAIACLADTSGIYHAEDGTWDVDGMKYCNVHEENESFSLVGIRYPEEEWNEWCLRYCRASIIPIDLDFTVLNDVFYVLQYCRGYRHWFMNVNNYTDFADYELNNEPTTLGYYVSRKKAKKVAARDKKLKKIGRAWVKPEFDEKCSPMGAGRDYLSISKEILE